MSLQRPLYSAMPRVSQVWAAGPSPSPASGTSTSRSRRSASPARPAARSTRSPHP